MTTTKERAARKATTTKKKTPPQTTAKKNKATTVPPAAINRRKTQAPVEKPEPKREGPSMGTVAFTVILFFVVIFTIEGVLSSDISPYQAPGDNDEFYYEVNTAQPE